MIVLLACILSSCNNKSPNRPTPPQAPPKPQAQATFKISASDVQKALFTYSSRPSFDYQNGQGVIIERRVIRT